MAGSRGQEKIWNIAKALSASSEELASTPSFFKTQPPGKSLLINFDRKKIRELDLTTSKVNYYIDQKHNLIWTIDGETKKIQTHSPDESMEIATLSNASEAKPVFVTENKILYYSCGRKKICFTPFLQLS